MASVILMERDLYGGGKVEGSWNPSTGALAVTVVDPFGDFTLTCLNGSDLVESFYHPYTRDPRSIEHEAVYAAPEGQDGDDPRNDWSVKA